MQYEIATLMWSLIGVWAVLVVNCVLLFVLLMKKNPTIIINNERLTTKQECELKNIETKEAIIDNEKHWTPPNVLTEPPEPKRVRDIPTFKGKPLASGFGDPKHG